jgi:hypothetical protein
MVTIFSECNSVSDVDECLDDQLAKAKTKEQVWAKEKFQSVCSGLKKFATLARDHLSSQSALRPR